MPHRSYFASYIVRIYRFQKNKPHALLGVVEEVGKKGKKAFTHYDELWEILNSQKEASLLDQTVHGRGRARKEAIGGKE